MSIFADYYDRLVGADYNRISNYIRYVINKFKPDSTLVCDLGCGTASIAIKLANAGLDMIAIDCDDSMLMCAKEKCFKSKTDSLLLLNQDLTEFELYGTVDVIYSTLDTLNYVTDIIKLRKLFSLVRNYLNFDGLFIFDINTKYKFEKILNGYCCAYDDENLFCYWESEYDEQSSECLHNLTFFEMNDDGKYIRNDEQQIQKYHSEKLIKELSTEYEFEILQITDDYTNNKPSDTTQRLTFVLKTLKNK